MSEQHDCGARQCKGTKYDGAYLTCSQCSKKVYCECMNAKKEILQLMNALQNVNMNANTPTRLQIKIKALFHSESVLNFTCLKCMQIDKTSEIINKIQKEYGDKYDSIIQSKEEEIVILKERYAQLEQSNLELHQRVNEINLNEQNVINMDISDKTENENDISRILKAINGQLGQKICDNISIMTSDIEARIKLEFEKLQMEIQAGNFEQERKRKKPQGEINNTPKTSENNKENEKVRKLKPPILPVNDNKDVYEIHVSKFDTKTTERDIESFIMEKTKIRYKELFKVTKLNGKVDDMERNYKTFKITTLNREVYGLIINERVWKPDFEVRDYYSASSTKNGPDRKQGLFRRKPDVTNSLKNNVRNGNDLRRVAISTNMIRNRKYEIVPQTDVNEPTTPGRQTPRRFVQRNTERQLNPRRIYMTSAGQPQQYPIWMYPQQPYVYYQPNNGQNFLVNQQHNQTVQPRMMQPQNQQNQV